MSVRRIFLALSLLISVVATSLAAAPLGAQQLDLAPQAISTVYLPLVRVEQRSALQPPAIAAFSAEPASAAPGAAVQLRWAVSGATSLRVEPGVGPVTGDSVTVTPAATTTYTLVATNGGGESRATVTVTVGPAQSPQIRRLFVEHDKKPGTPDIAVDAQGGTHLAYRYHVPADEGAEAVYAYCPPPAAQCADPARWQYAILPGPADEVQIELTPQGAPRILLTLQTFNAPGERLFAYGECDSACTSAASWSWTGVTTSVGGSLSGVMAGALPQRSFALDPQGRPRFVFDNEDSRPEPDQYGGYYAACDSACTDADSWTVTRFTEEQPVTEYYTRYERVGFPALSFTRDGQPRIVALTYPIDQSAGYYFPGYFACDAGCDDSANWGRVKLAERGQGGYPTWDIAIDGNGNPRIAFFKAQADDESSDRLHYLTCDGDCLNAGSWHSLNLGLAGGIGDGVDLVLDGQGRPRMAFLDGGEDLHYAWCDSACTSAASWQHRKVDSNEQMEQDYPVARPILCDAGVWDTGSPALALDGQGQPQVVYEGSYKARCTFKDPDDPHKPPSTEFIEVWHAARLVAF